MTIWNLIVACILIQYITIIVLIFIKEIQCKTAFKQVIIPFNWLYKLVKHLKYLIKNMDE